MVLRRTRKARSRRLTTSSRSLKVATFDLFSIPLRLDQHGWLKSHPWVAHAPSPNYDARPPGQDAHLLVLHNISLPPGVFGGPQVIDFFQNQLDYRSHPWLARLQGIRVSAHFLIRRTGHIVQFVATRQRAWHAGVSYFDGQQRCNDFSIGIELEGTDTLPYDDAQYQALSVLTDTLRIHHPIRAVRGHEHIAPERKTDPGPSFDWDRFARDGRWLRRQLPTY